MQLYARPHQTYIVQQNQCHSTLFCSVPPCSQFTATLPQTDMVTTAIVFAQLRSLHSYSLNSWLHMPLGSIHSNIILKYSLHRGGRGAQPKLFKSTWVL